MPFIFVLLKYIPAPYQLLIQPWGLTWSKQQGTLCCCSGKGLALPSSIVPRQTEARDTPMLPPLILQKHTRIPPEKYHRAPMCRSLLLLGQICVTVRPEEGRGRKKKRFGGGEGKPAPLIRTGLALSLKTRPHFQSGSPVQSLISSSLSVSQRDRREKWPPCAVKHTL